MTLEVYNGAPLDRRFHRQSTIAWVCLAQAADRKPKILRQWHRSFVTAVDEGRHGILGTEPPVLLPEPADPSRGARARPCGTTHLRRGPVEARRRPAAGAAIAAHGRPRVPARRGADGERLHPLHEGAGPRGPARRHVLDPDGTTAEALDPGDAQREHVHAHELHVRAERLEQPAADGPGRRVLGVGPASGRDARGTRRRARAARAAVRRSRASGCIRCRSVPTPWSRAAPRGGCSTRSWHLPFVEIGTAAILAGALDDIDVLVAPGGDFPTALRKLGDAGADALVAWVNGGGRYVGYRGGGAKLAAAIGSRRPSCATRSRTSPGASCGSRSIRRARSPTASDAFVVAAVR